MLGLPATKHFAMKTCSHMDVKFVPFLNLALETSHLHVPAALNSSETAERYALYRRLSGPKICCKSLPLARGFIEPPYPAVKEYVIGD
jgi:hypothetical protein